MARRIAGQTRRIVGWQALRRRVVAPCVCAVRVQVVNADSGGRAHPDAARTILRQRVYVVRSQARIRRIEVDEVASLRAQREPVGRADPQPSLLVGQQRVDDIARQTFGRRDMGEDERPR